MANIYQQKTRQRKIAYAVAILVLFTAAILYRHRVIEPRAYELQLKETARGEVELTSSAVRLTLTGSRGLATTLLWAAAIEKQKKHEWNELELLVNSITKLQPYFLTPWLFQSWNLAFNVAVECDRPRDKYYYVSRGIELLGEGERRNQGRGDFPGHPELRQTVGIYYLRKIGLSDEKTTMRCLLDLSCIDPLLRNPEWFYTIDPVDRRRVINTQELKRFCQANPRLVRRLREGLEYTSEKQIVDFLERNRDVPSRFAAPDWAKLGPQPPAQRQSRLKEVRDQFPTFPPPINKGMPNAAEYDLTPESMDVFLAARSWMEYSQQPLPPPIFDDKEVRKEAQRNRKIRLPKSMALIIFRSYHARCQAYIAENLEEEGWFDDEGWVIRDWFERDPGLAETEFRVGTETKYHAQPSWERAANLYYEYGRSNDLLFTPEIVAELNREAEPYRKAYKLPSTQTGELRSDDHAELFKSWLAHHRLIWSLQNRQMTNFDAHYTTAEAERARDAVMAHKLFFQAERLRRFEGSPELALERYDQAWPYWLNVLLQNPKFADNSINQEDTYEYQLKHIRLVQSQRSNILRPVVIGLAQMAVWPHPPFEQLMTPSDKVRIFPIRNVRALLDWVQIAALPDYEMAMSRYFVAAWPRATLGFPAVVVPPPLANQHLTRQAMRREPLPEGWRYLITEDNIQVIRDRLGVNVQK